LNIGIIGAGASGISAGAFIEKFSKNPVNVTLLEKDSSIGGHSSSFFIDGFTFDKGPHILFSRDKDVLNFLVDSLGDNVVKSRRNSRVYVDGEYALYPLENDLNSINPKLAADIVIEILNLDKNSSQPTNLDEWFRFHFGNILTELYFKPYNEKIWNIDFSKLSMSWADRIPLPAQEDIVRGAIGDVKEGYTHQLYFYYPKNGGYSAIPESLIKYFQGKLELNFEINSISIERNQIKVLSNNKNLVFDKLITTMPISKLVRIFQDVDPEIIKLSDSLIVNPMYIISFGFKGEIGHTMSAGYYADPKYLVNRVSFPKNFAITTCPEGCYSVQAEVTLKRGTFRDKYSDEFLIDDTLKMLKETKAIPSDAEPLFSKVDFFDYAYVVYDVDYEKRLNIIKKYFEDRNIFLHGRFGSHNYLNIDGCVIESIKLTEKILNTKVDLSVYSK
jgi:protoporphyrinogen oxidase